MAGLGVAQLECRVANVVDVEGAALIIANVIAAHADAEHFRDVVWSFDGGPVLIHHLDGSRFAVSDRVAIARRPS